MALLSFNFPFADTLAEVTGYYYPEQKECLYTAQGEPGNPYVPSEFEIQSFLVSGVDILEELDRMYVKHPTQGKFVPFLDYIDPILSEIADEEWSKSCDISLFDY